VQGGEGGHHGVEDALRDLLPVGGEHGVGGHQVADVAHQHQGAPRQAQLGAVGCGVDAVRVQPRSVTLPPLLKLAVRSPRIRPSQLR
jgi:hypothetical protein